MALFQVWSVPAELVQDWAGFCAALSGASRGSPERWSGGLARCAGGLCRNLGGRKEQGGTILAPTRMMIGQRQRSKFDCVHDVTLTNEEYADLAAK